MPPRKFSRYWLAKGKRNDDDAGTVFLGEREPPNYDKILTGEEEIYQAKKGETLPGIAARKFDGIVDENGEDIAEHLWWIIAEINDIMDLTLDLTGEEKLIIPSQRQVKEQILNR
jgi:hypothetical protein